MSGKKTTLGLYCTENFKQKILEYIGYSEQSGKSISESLIEYFEKLILDKSSPAPNSPNSEQKPPDEKPSVNRHSREYQTYIEKQKILTEETAKREKIKTEAERERANIRARNRAPQKAQIDWGDQGYYDPFSVGDGYPS